MRSQFVTVIMLTFSEWRNFGFNSSPLVSTAELKSPQEACLLLEIMEAPRQIVRTSRKTMVQHRSATILHVLPDREFLFGDLRLDADGILSRGDEVIHLPPKELAAFVCCWRMRVRLSRFNN